VAQEEDSTLKKSFFSLKFRGWSLAGKLVLISIVLGTAACNTNTGGDSDDYMGSMLYYKISGTVTSGASGVADVAMTLSGAGAVSVSTDANGRYTFSALANGSYTVTPTKTGFTFIPASSVMTISGADISNVNFTAASALIVQPVSCPPSGATNVSIQNFVFVPATISIPANSVVRWTNNDSATHTVTGTTVPANGAFDSSNLNNGASVCFQFTAVGTYNYHCSIHSEMTGTVTVQ
jgi:plastocyanin